MSIGSIVSNLSGFRVLLAAAVLGVASGLWWVSVRTSSGDVAYYVVARDTLRVALTLRGEVVAANAENVVAPPVRGR